MEKNKNHRPPRISEWTLGWLLKDDWHTPLGDFEEYYNSLCNEKGTLYAKWWYRLQVLALIPGRMYEKGYWSVIMLLSYAKVAFRSILRQKGYAFINVTGLAIGLAVFILMAIFVRHEVSYDRFHQKADRIYRIVQERPGQSFQGSNVWAITSAPMAKELNADYTQVETATTVSRPEDLLLEANGQFLLDTGIWADDHFFDVFSFPFVQGSAEDGFEQKGTIVLTASFAEELFGEENPIGQTIMLNDTSPYLVSAIMADVPENAHFSFRFVLPIESHPDYLRHVAEGIRYNNGWFTYLVLAEHADPQQFNASLRSFEDKHLYSNTSPAEHERVRFHIQALTDIHFGAFKNQQPVNFDISPPGQPFLLYLFSAIGLLVLLLACVNYTNLALARTIQRAREVGVRKALGSKRQQLIKQFLGESLVSTGLAFILSIGVAYLVLPLFSNLLGRTLTLTGADIAYMGPWLFVLVLIVGLLAGAYPALYMSSLKPAMILKGTGGGVFRKFSVQRVLLFTQYVVSITLIACGLIVYQQLQFVQNTSLGFERDHILTILINDDTLPEHYETLRKQWLQEPGIESVTISSSLPINVRGFQGVGMWEDHQESEERVIYEINADDQFFSVYNVELLSGRMFDRARPADSTRAIVINETAALSLGWDPLEAPGKYIKVGADQRNVVGVMKDFHLHSMHIPIEPLMIRFSDEFMLFISVKVAPTHRAQVLSHLEQSLQTYSPYPFDYQFLDQNYEELYRTEQQVGSMIGVFTVLALLIASLGLFGLAAYVAEQRKKEIGVRRVLGASARSIVVLLVKDFTRIVLFAAVLAIPVAYLSAHYWLSSFAYRVQVKPDIFVVAVATALTVALMSVLIQTLKAAMAAPINSLRHH
ncbi:MAG: ABC transporter permease [Rhodothermaceae bacterium]|nr:ABC transporter permease [Rhodothermaceae bacterium]